MLSVEPQLNLKELYEIDDHLWLETTIKLLKANRFSEIDIDNLIEELESLSRKDKATVSRFLELIIIDLLLLQYWEKESEYNGNHWTVEILNFRHQLDDLLTTNLYKHLDSKLDIIYQRALVGWVEKTKPNSIKEILRKTQNDNYC
jgi:hypothetical protein